MARHQAGFTQADVARAVNAMHSAGLRVTRCEIDPDGKIAITTALQIEQAIAAAKNGGLRVANYKIDGDGSIILTMAPDIGSGASSNSNRTVEL